MANHKSERTTRGYGRHQEAFTKNTAVARRAWIAVGLIVAAPSAAACGHHPSVPSTAARKPTRANAAATTPGATSTAESDAPPVPSPRPAWVCARTLPRAEFPSWEHFRDLDAVAKGSRSGRSKRTWNEQMGGRPAPEQLGRSLPPFVTRERAIGWTEHPRPTTVDLVSARRLAYDAQRWIILVAGKAGLKEEECSRKTDLRAALVEVNSSTHVVRRIARTRAPIVPRADWASVPEDLAPVQDDSDDGSAPVDRCHNAGFDDRVEVSAFDFAHYDLTPSLRALGLRTTRFEGYAGGFASFETLTLLTVDGQSIVPVLDVPIATYKMLAGDWNADQTRHHETISADLALRWSRTARRWRPFCSARRPGGMR